MSAADHGADCGCHRCDDHCDVYWGSHGCDLTRGHEGHHFCSCCDCDPHVTEPRLDGSFGPCVGAWPFYGPDTEFFGEDA